MGLFIHVSFLFLGTLMPNMLKWKELIDRKDSNSEPLSHDPTYHCHACNKTSHYSEANLLRYNLGTFSSDPDSQAGYRLWISLFQSNTSCS